MPALKAHPRQTADYIARAPAQQVTETREMLAMEEVELTNLKDTLTGL